MTESKTDEVLLSSENIEFERALINTHTDNNFNIIIEEYEFKNSNMVYIREKAGRKFLVDKTNVTFFSINK